MLTSVETKKMARALPVELPIEQPDPTRIAVLLNRNARKVTDRLARRVERIIGSDHCFYSRSLEEAEAFAREIVQRGYGTIISGGGDGTLARAVNLVHRYVEEANAWRIERFQRYGESQSLLSMPRFGFLRLGTGNGMQAVVGASHPITDLKHIVDFAPGRTHQIPLIENGNDRFFFGGMGYDSVLLNHYNELKARTKNAFLKTMMQNVTGYLATIFVRTLPWYLMSRNTKIEARVINHGRAFYIDPRRGDAAVEIEPGSTIFEGKAAIITAGTSPFFGYNFRMFPFANIMPGMMHLRIGTSGPIRSLLAVPKVWKGVHRDPDYIFDFCVEDVEVELERPYPFQHSGDAQGRRDHLHYRIADEPLKLLDYYVPRALG